MQYLRPAPRPAAVSNPDSLRAATSEAEAATKKEAQKAAQEFKATEKLTIDQEAAKKKAEEDKAAEERRFQAQRHHEAFLLWHENMLKELNEQRCKEIKEQRAAYYEKVKKENEKKAEDKEWMKNLKSQPSYRLYSRAAQKALESLPVEEVRKNLDNHAWRLEFETKLSLRKEGEMEILPAEQNGHHPETSIRLVEGGGVEAQT